MNVESRVVLELERSDGVARITLDRPERLNALSFEMVEALHAALDELEDDLRTRIVILSGSGRAFCAGLDLYEDLDAWPEDLGPVQRTYRMQQRFASLSIRLREIPQPVVATIRGPAAGGGLALACAADIRIADETARFNAAFVRVGFSAGDMGVSWFLPHLVGASVASELLYTGRFVEAEEARAIGLVSRVVAPADLDAVGLEVASQILANSPFGIRMTKELLNQTVAGLTLRQAIELENRTQSLCFATEDRQDAVAAFRERRSPIFHDR
jgi:enoyl-CoA hydratase